MIWGIYIVLLLFRPEFDEQPHQQHMGNGYLKKDSRFQFHYGLSLTVGFMSSILITIFFLLFHNFFKLSLKNFCIFDRFF